MIIKTLSHYIFKPVIVALPEFGIIETTNEMNGIIKKRNEIFLTFNNGGEVDNIKTYRTDLNNLLKTQKLNEEIIFIDFDKVCSNYENCKELFANPSHLNKQGIKLLSETIVNELKKEITPR